MLLAKNELDRFQGHQELFIEHDDLVVENFVNGISNDHLQVVGSELILGKIYEKIGFPTGGSCGYFRNLVLCRLVYPGSKLKTVDYFHQHLNMEVSVYSVYRFLDELNTELKTTIEITISEPRISPRNLRSTSFLNASLSVKNSTASASSVRKI